VSEQVRSPARHQEREELHPHDGSDSSGPPLLPRAKGNQEGVVDTLNIVEKRFLVKRAIGAHKSEKLHAKTICVGRELVSMASDNAYPHYIWVLGRRKAIAASFRGFVDGLWMESPATEDGGSRRANLCWWAPSGRQAVKRKAI
jgi:hypothetical protein